ncbi:MAG: ABC transporter ATP-binding protein [Bacilli bacterium]|nr:ABC transporter ATP-binding protein [Bacilli bacterium]
MILSLKGIRFAYPDGFEALRKVDAEIEEKAFVVVLGESGSGKTTLLKVIAGLLDPQEGEVFLNGSEATSLETKSRDLSMVFQNNVLYPHLTIYHNVLLGLNGFGLSEEEMDERTKTILSAFGLRNYLNYKPKHLSEGQRQRVCICKALIREPSLLLLDEPLSNLDEPQRARIRKELKAIFEERDTSFLYVSHDLKDASMATEIWIMDKGRIVQRGTAKGIREMPHSLLAFRLITAGEINEYKVRVESGRALGGAFSLESDKPEGDYVLAFTYKDAFLDPKGPIEGEVYSCKLTNSGILLNIKLKDDSLLGCYVDEESEIKNGDVLRFDIDRKAIRLFDLKAN